MRPLKKALQEHELIVLRVMGEWYDLDLTGEDKAACVRELAEALAELDFAQEILYLGPEEAAAVQTLVQGNGRSIVKRMGQGQLRLNPFQAKFGQIQRLKKGRAHPQRMNGRADVVVETGQG